jgi:hypothetical protein
MIDGIGKNAYLPAIRSASGGAAGKPASQLSDSDQQLLRQLRSSDQKIRAHEQAHAAAGGAHAGSVQLRYERGPDGKNYAVSGEVQIDISPESTPDATISKMLTVRQAALAPADPSSQDRAVAQQAQMIEAQARAEKSKAAGGDPLSTQASAAYTKAAAIGTQPFSFKTSS